MSKPFMNYEEVEQSFMVEFKALLQKYNASVFADSRRRGYFDEPFVAVSIDSKYEGDFQHDGTEIEIPAHFSGNS